MDIHNITSTSTLHNISMIKTNIIQDLIFITIIQSCNLSKQPLVSIPPIDFQMNNNGKLKEMHQKCIIIISFSHCRYSRFTVQNIINEFYQLQFIKGIQKDESKTLLVSVVLYIYNLLYVTQILLYSYTFKLLDAKTLLDVSLLKRLCLIFVYQIYVH